MSDTVKVSKFGAFLVHLFLYSIQIQKSTDQKKLRVVQFLWFVRCNKNTKIENSSFVTYTELRYVFSHFRIVLVTYLKFFPIQRLREQ